MVPGKCPKCQQPVISARIHGIEATNSGGKGFNAITFVCPNALCQAVLGCQIDPIAIKTDIVNEVAKLLGQRPPL